MQKTRYSIEEILKEYINIIEIPVAWGEMDAAQHVNNIVYLRYSETGRIFYLDDIDFRINVDNTEESSIGPILSEINCRYKMPITFPDTVSVATRVALDSIDEYSFQMEQLIISHKHQRVAAEVQAKIVTYDYQNLRKAPTPSSLIEKIKQAQSK